MCESLSEDVWRILLQRIKIGKCTPFLGAGAAAGILPLGSQIATSWAAEHGYPLSDNYDLIRVAQFLAVKYDRQFPKYAIQERFQGLEPPKFDGEEEPHGLLADLGLPLYITTNYDHFMFQALSRCKDCLPRQVVCAWHEGLRSKGLGRIDGAEPSRDNPVVYHLHGEINEAESMVLTEDDYLDFIANLSRDPDLVPLRIQEAFAGTSLLFLGYSIADWNFRVLFRTVREYLGRSLSPAHISVQLVPARKEASDAEKAAAQKYLDQYFKQLNVNVFWGTSQKFVKELRKRLNLPRRMAAGA